MIPNINMGKNNPIKDIGHIKLGWVYGDNKDKSKRKFRIILMVNNI